MKYVTCIYAIGSVTNRVVEYAKSQNIECVECHRLAKALEVIPSKVHPNDVVLLDLAHLVYSLKTEHFPKHLHSFHFHCLYFLDYLDFVHW